MNKRILDEYDIAKKCTFCEFASKTLDDEKMICKKKGVVHADYSCHAFRYDLMKRVPKRINLFKD